MVSQSVQTSEPELPRAPSVASFQSAEEAESVFEVDLRIASGRTPGLGVAKRHGVLVVRLVVKAGVAEEWNNKHPERQILPGDHIIEINGKVDLQDISSEVTKPLEHLRMTVRRPVSLVAI